MRALRALPIFLSWAFWKGWIDGDYSGAFGGEHDAVHAFNGCCSRGSFNVLWLRSVSPRSRGAHWRRAFRPRRARHYAHGCWQVVVLSDSGDCSAGARAGGIAARFPYERPGERSYRCRRARIVFEFDLNARPAAHRACARRGGHV